MPGTSLRRGRGADGRPVPARARPSPASATSKRAGSPAATGSEASRRAPPFTDSPARALSSATASSSSATTPHPLGFERRLERATGTKEKHLTGSDASAEHRRNLGERQTLDEAEMDH